MEAPPEEAPPLPTDSAKTMEIGTDSSKSRSSNGFFMERFPKDDFEFIKSLLLE
jgi:hypothetical protein